MDDTVRILREFEEEHGSRVASSLIIFYDPQDYVYLFIISDNPDGLYEAWMKPPYAEDPDEEGVWAKMGRPKELIWDCLNDIKRQWKKIAGEY